MTLPRHFNILINIDGTDVLKAAESYQPPMILEIGAMQSERWVTGGGADCNCVIPDLQVTALTPKRVKLLDGRAGLLHPRRGDGVGGLMAFLVID